MANHNSQQHGYVPSIYLNMQHQTEQTYDPSSVYHQYSFHQESSNPDAQYHGQCGYYDFSHQNQNYQDQGSSYNDTYPQFSQPPQMAYPYPSFPPPPNQKRKLMEKDRNEKFVSPKECFPVSSGTQHKQNAEGYVPKRSPIPSDVMSKLALAKSKLEANPYDPQAQVQLNAAMMEYHIYQNHKDSAYESDVDAARLKTGYDGPGLFTGENLVEPMSKEEIDSDDIRTFARPDMFMNLKPLRENFGKSIMRKYGWKEGNPLGNTGSGSIAPIELTVKTDRKGLINDREFIKKKPEGIAKNDGPAWICKVINTKNPICGIGELHQAMGIPTPIFKLVSENNGDFKWKVHTKWGIFTPLKNTRSKKQAKSECAYQALKEILRIESEQLGLEPPTEAKNSSFLCSVFIPSNKTLGGHKMLYRHFYKSGILQNVLGHHSDSFCQPNNMQYSDAVYDSTELECSKNTHEIPMHQILQTGANWMIKFINEKNASHALLDLCLSQNKPRPEEYSQYINGSNVVTIATHWGSFTHSEGYKSRKKARLHVSYQAIKEIMSREAAKFNAKPPIELAESNENTLSFSPDTS